MKIGVSAFNQSPAVPVFLGNAPTGTVYNNSFDNTITVYYLDGATDFSDTWYNNTTVKLDSTSYRAGLSPWLLSYGGEGYYGQDPEADPNGDGVPLLLAYALDLDPTQNQAGALPTGVVAANQFSIDYYAAASGITYTVQTSKDLLTWENHVNTDIITIDLIEDAVGMKRASVPMPSDESKRFLRLEVALPASAP